jgi:hypothetical protein
MTWKRKEEPKTAGQFKDGDKLPKPAATGLSATWKGVTVGFIEVTPKLAKQWLRHNVKNRKLREDTMNGYARDAHAGNWLVTHQGVAFDDEHRLIDGQHRLHGIVRADKPAVMMVTFGLSSKPNGNGLTVMDVVDGNAPRSVANVLELQHGMEGAAAKTHIAKVIACLCYPKRLRKATAPQTLTILKLYGKEIERCLELRPDLSALRGPKIMAAAAFAMAVNMGDTEEFLRRLNVGNEPDADSPIEQLRNFMITTYTGARGQSSISDFVANAELTLQCIYAFMKDEKIRKLSLSKEGADYFRAQQADRVKIVHDLFELPYFTPGSNTFAGPAIPPPSARETEYQKFREGLGIKAKQEEEECPIK